MRDDPSPEFEKFIAAAVEDGRYSDRGRVLDEALDLLRRRDALRADVRAGLAELDAGRSVDGDEVFVKYAKGVPAGSPGLPRSGYPGL